MELKEILSHAEAVQFLLYSIQHGKQTRTALKKALPKDVPTDALLDAMTDFGFLCRDGKQFRLNQERLEQLRTHPKTAIPSKKIVKGLSLW